MISTKYVGLKYNFLIFSGLTKLNLERCKITDNGLTHLRTLVSLLSLNLKKCPQITNNCRTLINDLQEGPQQARVGENEPDRRLVERMLQTLRSERRIRCGKRMAHPSQTVTHDLPVHARLRIHSDSFFPVFVPPAVPPEALGFIAF